MTRPPDFDELLGADVAHDERERLRRVHELLVEAGPPPEVSPEIAYGPTLGTTLSRRGSGRVRRRVLLFAAAVLVLAIAFLGGYLAGNWPMKLAATGLPKLPTHGYYNMWLMRNGKPYGSCGTFVVAGADRAVTIWLNAPYRLQKGDTWVVTTQLPGRRDVGPVVLKPV